MWRQGQNGRSKIPVLDDTEADIIYTNPDELLWALNKRFETSFHLDCELPNCSFDTHVHHGCNSHGTLLKPFIDKGMDFGQICARLRSIWPRPLAHNFCCDWFSVEIAERFSFLERQQEEHGTSPCHGPHVSEATLITRPCRLWDLVANRVIPYRYSYRPLRHSICKAIPEDHSFCVFDGISVVSKLKGLTSVHGGPVHNPGYVDLKAIRGALLAKGQEYVWFDVFCSLQESRDGEKERISEDWMVGFTKINAILERCHVVNYSDVNNYIQFFSWPLLRGVKKPETRIPFQEEAFLHPSVLTPEQADVRYAAGQAEAILAEVNKIYNIKLFSEPNLGDIIDVIDRFIGENLDFGSIYARLHPHFAYCRFHGDKSKRTIVDNISKARSNEEKDETIRKETIKSGFITLLNDGNYGSALFQPRRLWDLLANRVIPYRYARDSNHTCSGTTPPMCDCENLGSSPKFWAVSHSWTRGMVEQDPLSFVETTINANEWLVPVPKGVDLEEIRMELLNLGIGYVWLDVLCLRQPLPAVRISRHFVRSKSWKSDTNYVEPRDSQTLGDYNCISRLKKVTQNSEVSKILEDCGVAKDLEDGKVIGLIWDGKVLGVLEALENCIFYAHLEYIAKSLKGVHDGYLLSSRDFVSLSNAQRGEIQEILDFLVRCELSELRNYELRDPTLYQLSGVLRHLEKCKVYNLRDICEIRGVRLSRDTKPLHHWQDLPVELHNCRVLVHPDQLERDHEREQLRKEEWEVDIPSIGSIFKSTEGVVRYMNGLGVPLKDSGWDDDRHWLNRAWTLQEAHTESILGGVFDGMLDPRELELTSGRYKGRSLEDCLSGIDHRENVGEIENFPRLVDSMSARKSSNNVDKVLGIAMISCNDRLPLYDGKKEAKDVWDELIPYFPKDFLVYFLFGFHAEGKGKATWRPSWEQLMSGNTEHWFTYPSHIFFESNEDLTDVEIHLNDNLSYHGHVIQAHFARCGKRRGLITVRVGEDEDLLFGARLNPNLNLEEGDYTFVTGEDLEYMSWGEESHPCQWIMCVKNTNTETQIFRKKATVTIDRASLEVLSPSMSRLFSEEYRRGQERAQGSQAKLRETNYGNNSELDDSSESNSDSDSDSDWESYLDAIPDDDDEKQERIRIVQKVWSNFIRFPLGKGRVAEQQQEQWAEVVCTKMGGIKRQKCIFE